MQAVQGAPGRELAQVQGVRIAGQATVAGQESGQRLPLAEREQRISGRYQHARRGSGAVGVMATTSRIGPGPEPWGRYPSNRHDEGTLERHGPPQQAPEPPNTGRRRPGVDRRARDFYARADSTRLDYILWSSADHCVSEPGQGIEECERLRATDDE